MRIPLFLRNLAVPLVASMQCLLLVAVGNRREYRSVILQVHARRLKCLVERAVVLVVVSDSLTRRLHFGREVSVKSAQLVEREYRHLDVPSLLFVGVKREYSLLPQRLAEYALGRNVRKAVARRF